MTTNKQDNKDDVIIKFMVERGGVATGDLRRLNLHALPTYDALLATAKQLFNNTAAVTLKYIDEDCDKVTITTQQELDSAVSYLRSTAPKSSAALRFIVDLTATTAEPTNKNTSAEPNNPIASFLEQMASSMAPFISQFVPPPAAAASAAGQQQQQPSSSTSQVIHQGVVCDGCNGQIKGTRFKCCVCADYDLCETCQAKNSPPIHDVTHPLVQISHPVTPRFAAQMCHKYLKHCCTPQQMQQHQQQMARHFLQAMTAGGRSQQQQQLQAQFIEDVTLEDGAVIDLNKSYLKIWRLKNTGSVMWPEGTVLRFLGGERMGAPETVPVAAVAPGVEEEIVVEMTATEAPHRYEGFWSLSTPDGGLFGPRIWIDVSAADLTPAAPAATAPPVVEPATKQQQPQQQEDEKPVEATVPAPSAPEQEVPPTPSLVVEASAAAAEPIPPPSAPAGQLDATAEEEKILETLRAMGFTDDSLNLGLIRILHGDIEAVLYSILGGSN